MVATLVTSHTACLFVYIVFFTFLFVSIVCLFIHQVLLWESGHECVSYGL